MACPVGTPSCAKPRNNFSTFIACRFAVASERWKVLSADLAALLGLFFISGVSEAPFGDASICDSCYMKRKYSLMTKIVIAGGMIYLAGVLWIILDRTPSKSEAWAMAQQFVLDQLKPAKANFGRVSDSQFSIPQRTRRRFRGR